MKDQRFAYVIIILQYHHFGLPMSSNLLYDFCLLRNELFIEIGNEITVSITMEAPLMREF